jgi:uncharacterized protein YecE (DUF72 family)
MEFGKVQHIDNIDFMLPPDDPVTERLWQRLKDKPIRPLRIHVGGTEWGRVSWVGSVYPQGTKSKDFLTWYARQLNTVELNTVFYGLPSAETVRRWAGAVDEAFQFCPKFPEAISHRQVLKGVSTETEAFVGRMQAFGSRLGPAFLQLSDRFGPDQAGALQQYVRRLPQGFQVCVELRSEEWFRKGGAVTDGDAGSGSSAVRDTYLQLLESGVGTVITDVSGRRDVLHMRLTTPVAFIRFVTNSLHPTDYQRADAWIDRIGVWAARGLSAVYLFVHSPEELTSPEMMRYIISRMNERYGLKMPVPNLVNGGRPGNLTLF